MISPDRPAWLEVDLRAISANITAVKHFVSPATQILSVVKANAYGHGIKPAAKAAIGGGASALGVALLQEGIILREAGIKIPIVVMDPALPYQAKSLVAHNLSQTVTSPDQIDVLETEAKHHNTKAPVHLKIDTGMGRVGVAPEDALALAQKIVASPHLYFEGIATHIAWERAEDLDKAQKQIQTFSACLDHVKNISIKWRHATNSVMTVHLPTAHFDLVRVGLLTYGIPPAQGAKGLRLTPALSLKTRITQIRDFPAGQMLSYGGTHTLKRPSRIALIPLGYADGYSRQLSNRAHVLICGQPCPVVGTVCMDLILVDITEIPPVQPGEEVTLLGQQGERKITVTDLAQWAESIPHEIVSQLGTRLPRVYIA